MNNEVLMVVKMIAVFTAILVSKKLFGKTGLILWIGIASILANIVVAKSINIFGVPTALGNVLFASTFLATDILSECYSEKEARNGVLFGMFGIIVYLVVTQLALMFTPSEIDIAHDAMSALFSFAPRICICSTIMYFVANIMDVYLYGKMKDAFKGKHMWLRNNICTILCNCSENFLFSLMAFGGVYKITEVVEIAISASVIETFIALCDTPFLYAAKKIKN